MGIFSTKTETDVYVTTVKMVEDSPNPILDAVQNALVQNGDITASIIDASMNGFSTSVDSYYRYGRDKFVNGLPTADTRVGYVSIPAVRDILEGAEGEPVGILEANYDNVDIDYVTYEYLRHNQGFDYATGIVHNPEFTPVGEVYILDSIFTGDNSENITIVFEDREADGTPISQTSIEYTIPLMGQNQEIYSVVYHLISDPQKTPLFWNYNPDEGLHGELLKNPAESGEHTYLPIATIRSDKENLIDVGYDYVDFKKVPTELMKTTEHMLRIIGIDIHTLTGHVTANPGIENVDDVLVLFGADIQSNEPATLRYLFEYFNTLAVHSQSTKPMGYADDVPIESRVNQNTPHAAKTFVKISDGDARVEIQYDYIERRLVEGVIGSIDDIERENDVSGKSEYILRKQVTDTAYMEVTVGGLLHIGKPYKGYHVKTSLKKSLSGSDEKVFYIPISMEVAKSFSNNLRERNKLFYDCLHLVIHTVIITETKWYQTSIFRVIIQIILIVVAFFTGQYQLLTMYQALAAAAVQLMINMALAYALEWLVNTIGGDLALLLAAVVAVVGFIYGNVDVAFGTLPDAVSLLSIVKGITVEVAELQAEIIEEILEDQEELDEEYQRRLNELEAAKSLLNDQGEIDPLYALGSKPVWMPNEGPSDFYYRTLNTNPGLMGFDALHGWHDGAVQLPKGTDLTNIYV